MASGLAAGEAWKAATDAAAAGDPAALTEVLSSAPGLAVLSDSRGRTPLLIAAGEGHATTVALLIARGSDVSHRDKTGATALFVAARHGHADVVRRLIAAGACPRHRRYDGTTALHDAASGGHLRVVELLLASGAELNARDGRNITPLHLAVVNGHRALVQALVDVHGARPGPAAAADASAVTVTASILETNSNKPATKAPGGAQFSSTDVVAVAIKAGNYDICCDLLARGAFEVKDSVVLDGRQGCRARAA